MSEQPALFDPVARQRAQARARRIGFVDVLHKAVAAEVKERLTEVNRSFTAPVIVGTAAQIWADFTGLEAHLVAEAETLAIEECAHDIVISALHLHSSNDPVGQLVQMRRALRPDGLLLAPLFGGQSLFQLRTALAEAEAAITGGLAPRIHPMGEVRDLGHLLQRAGLALPVADTLPFTLSYQTPLHLLHELRAMGETNALTARHRGGLRRSVLMRALEIYETRFRTNDGRVPATVEVIMLTGWAPSESQQKPLRPGSATIRLAEALGTEEKSAGDSAVPRSRH